MFMQMQFAKLETDVIKNASSAVKPLLSGIHFVCLCKWWVARNLQYARIGTAGGKNWNI
jgi:hypothetical protein